MDARELTSEVGTTQDSCPPHDFGTPMVKGAKVRHFRNGYWWLICEKCGFTVRDS